MSGHTTILLAEKLSRVSTKVKGILIVLVVMDHNDWFRQLAPQVFGPLTFHVLGFFFLAFSFGKKTLTYQFFLDRIARYMVPYWWTLALTTLAFSWVFQSQVNGHAVIENFVVAALIGSASMVKTSSGLFMLWFLPCLFGLTCLLAVHDSQTSQRVRAAVWSSAIAVHFSLPYLTGIWMSWVPFGLVIASYVFFPGLIWRQLMLLRLPHYSGLLAFFVFLICYGSLATAKVHIEVGTLEIMALKNPLFMFLNFVSVFSAMLTLVWAADYFGSLRWLEALGENSMLIYLIHPACYLVLSRLWVSPTLAASSSPMLFIHACTTTALAVTLAYGASLLMTHSPVLSAWITPQGWRQWPPVAYWRMALKVWAVRSRQ